MMLLKSTIILGLTLNLLSLWTPLVQAAITDKEINALVEALRLAAPQTGKADDGLYSDWQIKPSNITRWSKRCLETPLTPAQFEADDTQARQVLACKMGEVLKEQYEASGEDELEAVKRTAAWWMTGQAESPASAYTDKVVTFYQQQLPEPIK